MEHPTTLIEFMQLYPTEDACAAAIFAHRWPYGFTCSRCGSKRAWFLHRRGLYECADCHYQGSLIGGDDLPGQPHRPAQVVFRHLAAGLIPKGALGRRACPPAGCYRQDRLASAPQDQARHELAARASCCWRPRRARRGLHRRQAAGLWPAAAAASHTRAGRHGGRADGQTAVWAGPTCA